MVKKIAIIAINFYQRVRRALRLPSSCRFTPSCSQYMKEAIERRGIIKGSLLGVRRILCCHPWNKGGWDPVPR